MTKPKLLSALNIRFQFQSVEMSGKKVLYYFVHKKSPQNIFDNCPVFNLKMGVFWGLKMIQIVGLLIFLRLVGTLKDPPKHLTVKI